jgi:serine/threonine protein kinase
MTDTEKSLEVSIGSVEYQGASLSLSVYAGDRFGDYILDEELGQGGMGTVWKARHFQITNRFVAVKFITQSIERSPELLERFKSEILTVSNIRHPNIINILTCDWDKTPPFYVMDFVSGKDGKAQDLADIIAAGEIPLDKIRQWLLQAAGALEAAHNKNVIHRDIKPANILIDADGSVKVCDFGLAKQQGGEDQHLSKSGAFIGTLSYASPEQRRGEKVDYRTDIFSLGYVLYEMLTGEHGGTPTLPSEIRDGLSEEWDDLYKKMVHPKLERRFQTMGEVITALQNISDNEPVSVKPDKPTIPSAVPSTHPPLLIRGNLALEESDWGNAVKYFDSVLNELPTYAPAYIGLLCTELKVHNENSLGDYKESISGNKNFQKALRFADADYKTQLAGYEEKIQETKLRKHYDTLVQRFASISENECLHLAEDFRGMNGYLDTAERAEECEQKHRELKAKREEKELRQHYDTLVQRFASVSEGECLRLAEDFRRMNGYLDTAERAEKCEQKHRELKAKREGEERKRWEEQQEAERKRIKEEQRKGEKRNAEVTQVWGLEQHPLSYCMLWMLAAPFIVAGIYFGIISGIVCGFICSFLVIFGVKTAGGTRDRAFGAIVCGILGGIFAALLSALLSAFWFLSGLLSAFWRNF